MVDGNFCLGPFLLGSSGEFGSIGGGGGSARFFDKGVFCLSGTVPGIGGEGSLLLFPVGNFIFFGVGLDRRGGGGGGKVRFLFIRGSLVFL